MSKDQQQPARSEPDHGVVVPLRPRRDTAMVSFTPSGHRRAGPPVDDLSRYERREDEDDDYRHRMVANLLALVFTAMLVVAGLWMANTIADMRKNQDCVLSGKRNCTPLAIPAADRTP